MIPSSFRPEKRRRHGLGPFDLFRSMRLAGENDVRSIALENVPSFLSCLDGQKCSSYSKWIESIERCGFTEHVRPR